MNDGLQQLKVRVGRQPFDNRLDFDGQGFCACPFHNGDGQKSMHLKKMDDGAWIATCFSACNQKKWDAIAFVEQYDSVSTAEAIRSLGGDTPRERNPAAEPPQEKEKTPKQRMTDEQWRAWGREITADDVARFAMSRKDKTAGVEAFRKLGCRVQGDFIGFPNRYTTQSGEVKYDLVRLRHMDRKEIRIEYNASMQGIFNRDTVSGFEDVFVVEGEPDVAVMEEAGYRAVSVIGGSQTKVERRALRRLMKADRIFLVGDMPSHDDEADEDPGQNCIDNLERLLRAEGAANIYRITFDDAHDVSELARLKGPSFSKTIADLRTEALTPWVIKNIPTVSQLDKTPPKWVVERLFPYGCLSLLCGKQGAQKSLIGLLAAKAITGAACKGYSATFDGMGNRLTDSKGKFLGREILHEVPVLYVDAENPQSEVSNRIQKIGILGRRNFHYWGEWEHADKAVPSIVDDPRLISFADAGGFIIFDSLQDWYGDALEIDNTAMAKLMNKFKHLARRGAGVLLLHHASKYGESGYRGATSIVAIPDMAILVKKNDDEVLEIREERFRMCGGWEIDAKITFGAEYYSLETLRDESLSAVTRREGIEKRDKADRVEADTERVVVEIRTDPERTPSTLGQALKPMMNAKRVEKLAATRGYTWDAQSEEWNHNPAKQATILPIRTSLEGDASGSY